MGDETEKWQYSQVNQGRIPRPGAPWLAIYTFADHLDGYAYTKSIGQDYQDFLEESETRFNERGETPESPEALLALIHLIYRRIRWTEFGNTEELEGAARPFMDAILTRLATQVDGTQH